MARPIGVTVLGILTIVLGILNIIAAIAVFAAPARGMLPPGVNTGMLIAAGVFTLLIGTFMLITGFAALQLKPWAWTGLLIIAILALLNGILGLFSGNALGGIVNILLGALIAYYLYTPEVKTAFGRPTPMPATGQA